MTPPVPPADQVARAAAIGRLDRDLYVEASAGTGKTTVLLGRVLRLLETGVPLSRIVVVTFLRAAAEELRVRLRAELAKEASPWARAAERDLPAAAIGTLHAFAQRLLRDHALAAGVDPGATVLEGAAEEAFRLARFRRFLERRVEEWPEPIARARALGARVDSARLMRWALDLGPGAALPPAVEPPQPEQAMDLRQRLAAVHRRFSELAPSCIDPEDRALKAGPALAAAAAALDGWQGQDLVVAACLIDLPPSNAGNQHNWRPPEHLREIKALLGALRRTQAQLRADAGASAAQRLLAWVAPFAAELAQQRREQGWVSFDDLLELTVDLLRRDPAARAAVAARFDAILVDEFQDTDPLQVALLDLVTDGRPGRRFAVGDPKQSIYRFRGADVATYLREVAAAAPEDRLRITVNFRTVPALTQAADAVMAPLFATGSEGDGVPAITYAAAVPHRSPAPAGGPPPLQVVSGPVGESAAAAREEEADAVARLLRAALDAPWRVSDAHGAVRRLRPGDVALLFARRTAYPAYLRALARLGVAARTGRDPSIWHHPVARAALSLLTAVDRPESAVAVVAALRSPLLGLSDQDLTDHVLSGGTFDLTRSPAGRLGRVATALRRAALAVDLTPLERLDLLCNDLDLPTCAAVVAGEAGVTALERVREAVAALAAGTPRPSLGEVLRLVRHGAQDPEGAGPDVLAAGAEEDDDGVRLLTVHEAKGLEFPVVVLGDLWSEPPSGSEVLRWRQPDGVVRVALSVSAFGSQARLETEGAAAFAEREKAEQAAETRRLFYVALTRARDVLVLPDFRPDDRRHHASFAGMIGLAAQDPDLAEGVAGALRRLGVAPAVVAAPQVAGREGEASAAALRAAGESWRRRAARLRAASAAAPIVRPSQQDPLGPWQPPVDAAEDAAEAAPDRDAAIRLGLAVHAVLAEALRAPGIDLAPLASRAAQTFALGRDGAAEVRALAERGMAHPRVRAALRAPQRRVEVPVSAGSTAGPLILGRVDLAFGDGRRVEVVDFKTDRLAPGAAAAAAKVAERGYAVQLALYARALTEATGLAVAAAHVLFLRTGEAVAVPVNGAAAERAPA